MRDERQHEEGEGRHEHQGIQDDVIISEAGNQQQASCPGSQYPESQAEDVSPADDNDEPEKQSIKVCYLSKHTAFILMLHNLQLAHTHLRHSLE